MIGDIPAACCVPSFQKVRAAILLNTDNTRFAGGTGNGAGPLHSSTAQPVSEISADLNHGKNQVILRFGIALAWESLCGDGCPPCKRQPGAVKGPVRFGAF